jgi:hypothetical protein
MKSVEVVVARYNEKLTWIKEYPFNHFNYIVYNKGDNNNFEKSNVKQIINLPNVGRCDHTYLYHIITNYNKLSDVVVFFTGSINMPHKKNKAKKILENIIKSGYNNSYFIGSYYNNVKYRLNNFLINHYRCNDPQNYIKNSENILHKCKIRPYGNWYQYFFGNICVHLVSYGGIFSVDKREIIQHPITRYQRLIETVNKNSNPEAGHYIERSWTAIFYPMIHTIKIVEQNHKQNKEFTKMIKI